MGQAKLRGNKEQRILTHSEKWAKMKEKTKKIAQLKSELLKSQKEDVTKFFLRKYLQLNKSYNVNK